MIKLPVGPELAIETSCMVPGISLGAFPTGDAQAMQPAHDIIGMSMDEPEGMPGKLAFIMKVASLSTLPPNTLWAMRFFAKTKPSNGDVNYFVGMSSEDNAISYVWGTVA